MNGRRLLLILPAIGAVTLAAAAARPRPRRILAGAEKAVWLIECHDAKRTFDLSIRKPQRNKWPRVQKDVGGKPAAVAALGNQLHVLFSPDGYSIFDLVSRESAPGGTAEDANWPQGVAPLAMCVARGLGTVKGPSIVAVVPRPAPVTAGATRPRRAVSRLAGATRPAGRTMRRVHLGFFQRVVAKWTQIADRQDVVLTGGGRVLVASAGGSLSLLLWDGPGAAARLAEWIDGRWQQTPLPGPLASAQPLAMLTFRGRIMIFFATPAEDPTRRQVLIATQDAPGGPLSHQPMLLGEKPATWAPDELPQVAALGDEALVLLWPKGAELRHGTCDPENRQLLRLGSTGDFEELPAEGTGGEVLNYFMWFVLGAIFIPLFFLRPRRAGPFMLPESLRTGRLWKRLIAGLIDLSPFNVMAYLLTPRADRPAVWDEADGFFERLFQQQISLESAVAAIAMVVLYTAYCTVMETRFDATLGKMVMKLRVVGTEGSRPGFRSCLLRNLMKIVELMFLIPPFLLLVPLLNRNRQRLGDMFARTTVVDASGEASVPPGPPGPPQQPPGPPRPPPDDGAD